MNSVELSTPEKVAPNPWWEFEEHVPSGYRLSQSGLSLLRNTDEVIISGPVWVSGTTRSMDGNEWGLIVTWIDKDEVKQACAVPYGRLHERGAPLAGELATRGLKVIPGRQNLLMTYLGSYDLPSHMKQISVAKLGWVDCAENESPKFMTPKKLISLPGCENQIMFQPEAYSPTIRTMRSQGSMDQWRTFVAEPCIKHPVLFFSLCAAFAGPLLKYASLDCGGFHLYGASSKGKTTALQVAASVWGSGADPANNESAYISRWNTTGNAMEAIAAAHNDGLLCLDEVGTCDARDMGKVIYDLFGGRGKSRLNKSSLLQPTRTWRIQGLSTGEISLKQKIEEGGGRAKTGHLIRMLDVPIDEGVVNLDVCANPRELIEELKLNAERFYGHAGPAYIERLIRLGVDNRVIGSHVSGLIRGYMDAVFEATDIPESFQQRAVRRFAVVAVAGFLAVDFGILPGNRSDVVSAVGYVNNRWLGDTANQPEPIRALVQLREFIIAHQDRFRAADNDKALVRDLVGYRAVSNNVTMYLFTHQGLSEATRGFDSRVVLEELKSRGFLSHDKGRLKSRCTIAGIENRMQLYAIRQSFLTDELRAKQVCQV